MGKVYKLAPRVDFLPLDTGEYVVTLVSWAERVEERDTQYSKRGDIRIEWRWRVEVPDAEPEERRDWGKVPATCAAKSKFVRIAVALGLFDEESGAEHGCSVDWDRAIGQRAIATIVKKLREGTQDWTDTITAYRPYDAAGAPRRRGSVPARDDNGGRRTDAALAMDEIPF